MNFKNLISAAILGIASTATYAGSGTAPGAVVEPSSSIIPPDSLAAAIYTSLGGGSPALYQTISSQPGAVIDPITGNATLDISVGGAIFEVEVDQGGNVVRVNRKGAS